VIAIDPAPTPSYTSIEVEGEVTPEDEETYYAAQYSTDPENLGWTTTEYQGPFAPGNTALPVNVVIGGLTPGTEYKVRLVALNLPSFEEVFSAEPNPSVSTLAVGPPSISIDPVTTFDGTTATFTGSIDPEAPGGNPDAFDVTWHLECTPECPGLGFHEIDADSDSHPISESVNGLEPNTSYEVTLIAENAAGPVSDGPEPFETDAVAPVVQTLNAGPVGTDSAVLAANVNPRNSATTYQFEWGTEGSFANVAPAAPQDLGAEDNAFHVVTAPIDGLDQGSHYEFRVTATNTETSEAATGNSHGFTTLEPPSPPEACSNAAIRGQQGSDFLPDCRAYEMVSPLGKGSRDINRNFINPFTTSRASDAGDRVAYMSLGSFAGIASGAAYNQYLSVRGDGGWSTRGVSPPLAPYPESGLAPVVSYFSSDLRYAAVATNEKLTPDAANLGEEEGLYRSDLSGDGASYELLSKPFEPLAPSPFLDRYKFDFAAATPDTSRIVFSAERRLTADAPPGDPSVGVYEWSVADGLRLVSVLPDGDPAENQETGPGSRRPQNRTVFSGENIISEDGRSVFFSVEGALYIRKDGAATQLISRYELDGDDPLDPPKGEFQVGRAADGSSALFLSSQRLTEDTAPKLSFNELFEWDSSKPAGEQLTNLTATGAVEAQVVAVVGASRDLDSAYFVATGAIEGDAQAGKPNLYLWHKGSGIRYIATLSSQDESVWSDSAYSETRYRDARTSPDGGELVFTSTTRLTAFDNGGRKQVYRYEAAGDELTCVSCAVGSSAADSELFRLPVSDHTEKAPLELPRNLSADGSQVIFETAQRLVPRDINGKLDVYRWRDGRVDLVSGGRSAGDSLFIDASSGGDDVFFTTRERLVGSDSDNLVDVYDASVTGGFLESVAPGVCAGDGCQGAPVVAPVHPTPVTTKGTGHGNATKKRRHKKKGKHKKHKGKHKGHRQKHGKGRAAR
jgi:hypothetical protein